MGIGLSSLRPPEKAIFCDVPWLLSILQITRIHWIGRRGVILQTWFIPIRRNTVDELYDLLGMGVVPYIVRRKKVRSKEPQPSRHKCSAEAE